MTHTPEQQLFRLASDHTGIYQDARQWFFDQGPSIVPVLIDGLDKKRTGIGGPLANPVAVARICSSVNAARNSQGSSPGIGIEKFHRAAGCDRSVGRF